MWIGSLRDTGYGRIYWNGKHGRKAHRVAWEVAHGAIPPGMNVLHRCDERRCVNPAHLFLGTLADNNRDTWEKGRHPTQRHQDALRLLLWMFSLVVGRPPA